ncbi:barstar family protein [Hymenobacter sp. DH14]|uniref:Barstar family protein n=1 Tax=Hymenobacter cyanobacteriorum TaxID=2926463 RepID=A0A9X1VHW2_9BACT|nr:barstar family protein [Hymenobacter cyanobacteriorum]MCI1188968.1 barstar family protein [Hymenobacter cyanobacteriorum]
MTIDLTDIDTKAAFHMLMKRELGFPDWYGVSWDAFWDAIIAVVEMPDTVVLQHWQAFAQACPHDMAILRDIIANYPREKPGKQFLLTS